MIPRLTPARPAESLTGVAAVGSLLAIIFGVKDPETIACMVAGLGLLPGAVSLLIDSGGVRGALRKVWRGREPLPTGEE